MVEQPMFAQPARGRHMRVVPLDAAFTEDEPTSELPLNLSDWAAEDFSRAYVHYRPMLERHVRRSLSDEAEVDEVIQDTFLYLFLSLPELDSVDGLARFLKWKASKLCLDVHRARNRRPMLLIDNSELIDSFMDPHESAESSVDRMHDAAVVHAALAKLPERQREALLRTEFRDETAVEIGADFNMSPNAVRQLIFRARANFRNLLLDGTDADASEILSVAVRKAKNSAAAKITGAVSALVLIFSAYGAWNANSGAPMAIDVPQDSASQAATQPQVVVPPAPSVQTPSSPLSPSAVPSDAVEQPATQTPAKKHKSASASPTAGIPGTTQGVEEVSEEIVETPDTTYLALIAVPEVSDPTVERASADSGPETTVTGDLGDGVTVTATFTAKQATTEAQATITRDGQPVSAEVVRIERTMVSAGVMRISVILNPNWGDAGAPAALGDHPFVAVSADLDSGLSIKGKPLIGGVF